jgi:hypothetical protein
MPTASQLPDSLVFERHMSASPLQALPEIIHITQQMLIMARENQWRQVAEMEARRRLLVQSCFQRPTPEQEASDVVAAIREILRLNEEVAELGQQWRGQLGTEIHAQKVGRAASAAYLSHTR